MSKNLIESKVLKQLEFFVFNFKEETREKQKESLFIKFFTHIFVFHATKGLDVHCPRQRFTSLEK